MRKFFINFYFIMNLAKNKKSNGLEGWLNKQGFLFKIWNRRYFILKDTTLSYYLTPGGKCKGTIPLENSNIEMENDKKKENAFKITTPNKIYHFYADTEEELHSWLTALMIANGQKIGKIGINDFDIIKVLGRGSLGKVQLARYKKNGKYYALKSMSKVKLEEINLVFQTLKERNALITINHPFIVSAKYTFQTETAVFIALDYVPGGELLKQLEIEGENNDYYDDVSDDSYNYSKSDDDMYSKSCDDSNSKSSCIELDLSTCNSITLYDDKNFGGFDLKRARFYAAQLALAIQYLHSVGFIHRDLKPSNILIDVDGYIKLIDFGFVKEKMFGVFAKTSTFCGTPMYAAPEIIKRKPYGRSVDWWSFGIILYEMIFYKPPFLSENLNTLFELITKEKLSFPSYFTIEGQNNSKKHKEIPFMLVDFLNRLLEKDPHKRLGTFEEEEIFNHPFFEGIEWKKLLNKEIPMVWKPNLKDKDDVSNFYDQFTKEVPTVSVIDPLYVTDETNEAFSNFTYIDADGVLSNI